MHTDSEANTIIKAIEYYGRENQIIVAIEEISEFLYALSEGNPENILEECVDAQISLFTLKICGIKFGRRVRNNLTTFQAGLCLIKGLTKILRKDSEIICEYDLIEETQQHLNVYLSRYNNERIQGKISAKLKRLEDRINNKLNCHHICCFCKYKKYCKR